MANLTDAGENMLVDALSSKVPAGFTAASTANGFYIGLLKHGSGSTAMTDANVDDGSSGAFTEVASSYDYERLKSSDYFGDAAVSGATDNSSAIEWATANGGDWSLYIRGIGIWTALTGGTLVAWADFGEDKVVEDGDKLSIAEGELDISAD